MYVLRITLCVLAMFAVQTTHPSSGFGQSSDLFDGGHSIFHETMADMTFPEVEEAARNNAIILWPMGAIEEHGPHLPLSVDVYSSYLRMKHAARLLRAQGIEVIVAPPMFWGINTATASFAGSLSVRPATLKAIIDDTFASFRKDGFRTVYVVSGHGDQLHNRVIVEGVAEARDTTGIRGFVVMSDGMKRRLQLTGEEPHVIFYIFNFFNFRN